MKRHTKILNATLKLLLVFVFLFFIFVSLQPIKISHMQTLSNPTHVRVVANQINVYQQPSENSVVLANFKLGKILPVNFGEETFWNISFEINNEKLDGYILKAFVINADLIPQKINLDTNAKVIKSCRTYELKNEIMVETSLILNANTRIKLLDGFDEKKQFQRINIEIENQIVTKYVQTDNIKPDGLNQRSLVAFMLIVVCVSIFLILYGFLRGKKHQRK